MLKRDSLMAQMQQLSHTLAKVKRLIVEEQKKEALSTLEDVLETYFGTTITDLLETPADVFTQNFTQAGFKPEELGLLADFLDELAKITGNEKERRKAWEKVILIYDVMEREHKVVSFAHLVRRDEILALLDRIP